MLVEVIMANDQTSLAQRSQEKLYFDHKDMDYYLSWLVGRQIYDGSEAIECFDVAGRIEDGDAESWQREWGTLAHRVEDQARMAASDLDTRR
jgi:hypothetical protein